MGTTIRQAAAEQNAAENASTPSGGSAICDEYMVPELVKLTRWSLREQEEGPIIQFEHLVVSDNSSALPGRASAGSSMG